jgi:hypothetical protein
MNTKIILTISGLMLSLTLSASALTCTEMLELQASGYWDTFTAPNTGPFSAGRGGAEEIAAGAIDAGIPGFIGPDGLGVVSGNNYVNTSFVGFATGVVKYKPSDERDFYGMNGIGNGFDNSSNVLGPVTGNNMYIVSLGDMGADEITAYKNNPNGTSQPGYITLSFDSAIRNSIGADFSVFENGFISNYNIPETGGLSGQVLAELAFVEVSTDGVTFARFPSIYLNTADNIGLQFDTDGNPSNYSYGTQDVSYIYNLAGKHNNAYGANSWGTPFDLDDLRDNEYVLNGTIDLDNILYVRVVDIPGNGTFTDSLGNSIYDPWVTWGSGGFDLEAVGVLNSASAMAPVTVLAGTTLVVKYLYSSVGAITVEENGTLVLAFDTSDTEKTLTLALSSDTLAIDGDLIIHGLLILREGDLMAIDGNLVLDGSLTINLAELTDEETLNAQQLLLSNFFTVSGESTFADDLEITATDGQNTFAATYNADNFILSFQTIPEPSTWALLGAALGLLVILLIHKKRTATPDLEMAGKVIGPTSPSTSSIRTTPPHSTPPTRKWATATNTQHHPPTNLSTQSVQ